MQPVQQFCLRWNNHQPNFISVFTTLLSDEALVDVTLACEGKHLQAHRVVLSACSAYFQTLFTVNPCKHPIVILKDIKFKDLRTMVDFMYNGEVNVSQEQLPAILKIAEMLKIKGLADMPQPGTERTELLTPSSESWRRSSSPMSPAMRRKRLRKTSTGSGSGSTEQTSEEVVGEVSGPCVKVEHVADSDDVRVPSRSSLRTGQEPSTDSEPREGSQDSGGEETSVRLSAGTRHLSVDSRHGSFELRQLSHDSRQSSITDGRQASNDRQSSHERQHSQERQASHDSRLSHDSSIESVTTDVEASPGRERIGTKRGRLLMRQERVKKESDTHTSPDSEPGSPVFPRQRSETASPLTITRNRNDVKVEPIAKASKTDNKNESSPSPVFRQRSEPCSPQRQKSETVPVISPSQPNQNLLAVPQPTYPARTLSLPNRVKSGPTSESQDEGGHFLLLDALPLPMVRVIPDDKPEPPPTELMVLEPYRSGHCPVLRSGPALGCNFCWNTIDNRGRILRRKTKYHCPECQTNLCIVPCFQEYHQRTAGSVGAAVTSSS